MVPNASITRTTWHSLGLSFQTKEFRLTLRRWKLFWRQLHWPAAPTVIPKLDRIFATHGIPEVMELDNGPPSVVTSSRDMPKKKVSTTERSLLYGLRQTRNRNNSWALSRKPSEPAQQRAKLKEGAPAIPSKVPCHVLYHNRKITCRVTLWSSYPH